MIKLNPREMKNLSRILTVMLCFAPLCVNAAGNVATTAGNNLTAFNPSTANNNQWATLSNGRYDSNVTAKADFGNCNAVVLRCAQPKCGNGGCTDASIASSIVAGCVQSNANCKQYGNDLVQYMTAQLVASSTAKVNQQNAAAQQAAAAAAAQQSQQQMAAMQQQMQQMQYQMQQQQAESQQQLQAALAQQAAQSQAALSEMKSAATAAAMENEAGISAYQQDAINRGISADVLERQKITGQIMTELENAEVSLKEVKTAINSAFEYAKCDSRGNNCEGPKRIKKWRELATEFLDPYYNSIDKLYDALTVAQNVGVDLSQIYMMLDDSCNSWGQYMCPQFADGTIVYSDTSNGQKGTPYVCYNGKINDGKDWASGAYANCSAECYSRYTKSQFTDTYNDKTAYNTCMKNCLSGCKPCTLLKVLSGQDEVYEGWVNAEYSTGTGNTTVVACASGVLDSSKFFASRSRKKNGASLVDIEKMDVWLKQKEPPKELRSGLKPYDYCDADGNQEILEKSVLSRIVDDKKLCVEGPKQSIFSQTYDEDCGYINPIYAICDTHPYNAGKSGASSDTQKFPNDCYNVEHALWAEKKDTKQQLCEAGVIVRWCENGYKPSLNKTTCEPVVEGDDWKSGKPKYDEALAQYNQHVAAKFGDMKEIIALKTTVISQQMYKQYEYLSATLRRLKTQLEKATLTAQLQAAGAKNESGSSSGLLGSKSDSDKEIVLAGAENCWNASSPSSAYSCIQTNLNLVKSNASTNKQKAAKQLGKVVEVAKQWDVKAACTTTDGTCKTDCDGYNTNGGLSDTNSITKCANALSIAVARKIDEEKKDANKYSYRPY